MADSAASPTRSTTSKLRNTEAGPVLTYWKGAITSRTCNSEVIWFEGNLEAYEEDRRRRLGAEADRPHRITYKRLTRD